MNFSDFTYLLNHPEAINAKRTEELDQIVSEFPYFQSARALRLKGLFNEDSFRYNYALKVTAAFTADRSVLFDFITSDTFNTVHRELYDKKQGEMFDIVVRHEAVEVLSDKTDEPIVPALQDLTVETRVSDPESAAPLPPQTQSDFEVSEDPAMKSVMDSIREAGQMVWIPLNEKDSAEIPEPSKIAEPTTTETEKSSEESKAVQENLALGKPLEFSNQETHSFQEWLKLSKAEPIDRSLNQPDIPTSENAEVPVEDSVDRQKKNKLIDRFIESNPKIPALKSTPAPASYIFEPSRAADNSYLMTETLARVYLEQKKYEKAIQAYEILILKYPEKSSFFADRILDIRNLKQNNN